MAFMRALVLSAHETILKIYVHRYFERLTSKFIITIIFCLKMPKPLNIRSNRNVKRVLKGRGKKIIPFSQYLCFK